MKHELKIWPQYYQAVADGSKTFEIRKNDRGFQKGDVVILREWDPTKERFGDELLDLKPEFIGKEGGAYTDAPELVFSIGYVLPIDSERVVFSLLKF